MENVRRVDSSPPFPSLHLTSLSFSSLHFSLFVLSLLLFTSLSFTFLHLFLPPLLPILLSLPLTTYLLTPPPPPPHQHRPPLHHPALLRLIRRCVSISRPINMLPLPPRSPQCSSTRPSSVRSYRSACSPLTHPFLNDRFL